MTMSYTMADWYKQDGCCFDINKDSSRCQQHVQGKWLFCPTHKGLGRHMKHSSGNSSGWTGNIYPQAAPCCPKYRTGPLVRFHGGNRRFVEFYYHKQVRMAKKRGQGQRSIYRRRDGLWVAQVTIQGKHLAQYSHTQTECRGWLRTALEQAQNGMTLASARITVTQYLSEWLGSMNDAVRPHTHEQYAQIVRQHIVPRLGAMKLKDLRPDHIQGLYNEKLKDGMSSRSLILVHGVLHNALKHAVQWGKIVSNPTDAVNRPKFRRKAMHVLDDKQARQLLLAAKGTRYEALFWMAISTGMRQGELLGLRWPDIDWRTRQVHVQRQVQPVKGGGYVLMEPKPAAGRWTIILGEGMIQVLRAHIAILQTERQEAGDEWQEGDLVFPSSRGSPWHQRNVMKYFKRFLHQAGLPDPRFHDLQHTAATLMLQQGISPKVVQEILGHADITLTLNTYSHVTAAMQKEAAAKVDELLTPIEVREQLRKVQEQRTPYTILSMRARRKPPLSSLSKNEDGSIPTA